MSRVCELFTCVPSVALREMERHTDLIGRIAEYRDFERAFRHFRDAKDENVLEPDAGDDPMLDLVWAFTAEDLKRTDDDE